MFLRIRTSLGALLALSAIAPLAMNAATAAAAPAAQAEIKFTDPQKFADIGETHRDREDAMRQLSDHLKAIAARELPGKQLTVEFTDVDLAGEIEPKVSTHRVRVLRTVTIPRLDFNYTLSENGAVVKSGKASLRDLNYQSSANRYFDSEALRYEKKLLDDWMAKELLGKDRLARSSP